MQPSRLRSPIQCRPLVGILLAFLGGCTTIFSQEVPTGEIQPLLPFATPPLIPEPLIDTPTIAVDPEPMVFEPNLFTRDSPSASVRTAEMIERRAGELGPEVEPPVFDPTDGAASAFGIDSGIGSLTRPSVAGAQAERESQRILARAERQADLEHYNVKIGPVPFRFGAGVELQFSDNANLSGDDKLADLTILPHIDVYGGIKLSRQNTLSIQLGLGYLWNLNRPELDRALTNAAVGLDSDTGFSLDMKMGNFRINLHERPAIPRQQFDLITQRNPLQYSQFTNVAGVTVFWDVNSRLSASFNYDHLNVISLKSEVENLDQSSDLFGASINYSLGNSISLSLQANASFVKYKRNFLNEANNYDVGVGVSSRIGRHTTVRVVAGYQIGEFGSGGQINDNTSLSDWYFRLVISQNVNRYLGHSLSLGHESQIGTASNSTSVDYIRHQMTSAVARSFGLGTILSLDSARESGGLFAQEFKLYQLGVYGYWSMSKKLSLTFNYRLTKRDASGDENELSGVLDYIENRVDLGLQLHL